MIDLNDLALFVQVVQSGSFAEASRRLGMPPNTVSRRILQLEQQLGMRLLQRSTRKLTLTSAGQTLHERTAGAVQGLSETTRELMTGTQEPSGLIRIAAPADFFDFFLMDWTAEFLQRHPKVSTEFLLSDLRADLIAERIDVAFRGGPLADSGYVGKQLLDNSHQGLMASPAYLAQHGTPGTLQDLRSHACVSFTQAGSSAVWRLTGPGGREEEVQFTPRFSGNTALAVRKAAAAGIGIALLPHSVARMDLAAGHLVPVLPHYRRAGSSLHVLYPSRRHLPLAVSAFIALVVEKLEQGLLAA